MNPAADLEDRREKARELVVFTIELALLQLHSGRHFLIENPLGSRAWQLPEMQEFLSRPDVLEVVVDMCSFNLRSAEGVLHKKATQLLTSSQTTVSSLKVADALVTTSTVLSSVDPRSLFQLGTTPRSSPTSSWSRS